MENVDHKAVSKQKLGRAHYFTVPVPIFVSESKWGRAHYFTAPVPIFVSGSKKRRQRPRSWKRFPVGVMIVVFRHVGPLLFRLGGQY